MLLFCFSLICHNNKHDIQSDIILEHLKTPVYKLYLQFSQVVLPLFINLNIQMQSEKPQISTVYSAVTTVVQTFFSNLLF
jgi:hypothetical protein